MKRVFALILAIVSCACVAQMLEGLPVLVPSVSPPPPPPASPLNVYVAYGQSWAAGNQSSYRNTCLGNPFTPAGPGQVDTTVPYTPNNFMMPNWGAPNVGANTSFQASQVTALLNFYDCGPNAQPFSKRDIGQSLGSSVSYLKSQDGAAGRGTISRGYFEAGIGGQPITILSKPTTGEACSDSGTGPQCFCYANASGGTNGNNGAQCVFPFNQAWVGSTSMLGAMKAQATASGQNTIVRAVSWHQGPADKRMTQSAYYAKLAQLFIDTTAAVEATTGQSEAPHYIVDQTMMDNDGTTIYGPALAQLQYIRDNVGNRVHGMGPMYYRHAIDPPRITISGTLSSGTTGSVAFTSSGISGSPVTIPVPGSSGDSAAAIAGKLTTAINSEPALVAAGLYAINVSGALIDVYSPGTLQPPFTLSAASGTDVNATFAYSIVSSHEVNADKVWKAEQIGQCEDLILKAAECPVLYATSASVGASTVTLTYGGLGAGLLTAPLVADVAALPAAANKGFAIGVGMARPRNATAAGSSVIVFGSSQPTFGSVGQYVFDLDTPCAIPAGTTVAAVGATTITLSAPAACSGISASGVNGNADRLVFSTCQRSITDVSVAANTITVTLDGSPTGCTLSYALWGEGQQQLSGPVDSVGNHQLTGFFGAYGNIRDSYGATGAFSGRTLRNFAMAQQWSF